MRDLNETRRRFMAHFTSIGLGATLLPGVLWARMQQDGAARITGEMLNDALSLSGLEFPEADRATMVQAANQILNRYEELRKLKIPNDVSPPFHFSSIVPGIRVNRTRMPFRMSDPPSVKRPANLEEAAFWPVTHLAQLVKSRQVTSTDLTSMYLARLHKYNPKLNCVVTFLDDLAMAQAKQADAEIAAGRYKGPLHGIPWGAKDIIAVKGYKTTWGSAVYKDQVIDEDASVVEMLREAGAVLVAKLATGELAQGDNWFGGQTKSPWDPNTGSSGSSAGPGSATAAGLVGFSIGTETSGSILSPSARCGVAGLRPTFGRISRYGVMALSWTQDRLGPMCRTAEDCALVMNAISRLDGRDMSVSDLPFNWDAKLDIRKLRVGYIKDGFEEATNPAVKQNAQKTLEQIQALGIKLVQVTVPEFPVDTSAFAVESAVFFEELVRSGRDKQLTNPNRSSGWRNSRLMPAVEYLQIQRARMMMMMKLAEATAGVDVYLAVASGAGGGGARGARGDRGAAPEAGGAPAGAGGARGGGRGGAAGGGGPQSPTQRHSNMANSARYPALNVPNGFNENGSPTSVTFFARPFGETELLALARAYQDAAGFHLKHPKLD